MTKRQLTAMLVAHDIPLSEWGAGKAKTVDHLYAEIESGEAVLKEVDGKLVRAIAIAVAYVTYRVDGRLLILKEDRQELRDGRIRRRGLLSSLSEKMGPDEDPEEAMHRAIRQELGIAERLRLTFRIRYEVRPQASGSYPGLVTKSLVYEWEAEMPARLFRPDGYVEVQEDKTNHFVWQPL